MSEVDRLREAMRATERTDRNALDLTTIMREGRRLRRRRRLAGAGGAALSVAVVVVGVTVGVQLTGPPDPERPAAPVVTAPAAAPTTGTPTATPDPEEPPPQPVGDVVPGGIRYGDDERVFYLVPVDVPELPGVTIGLVAGRRAPDGRLTSDFLVNDVEGSDRHPGFHEIGYDQSGPASTQPPVPTFGYFVGPAKQIVGTVDGHQVHARLARWSEDPSVVIFWFDPAVLAPGTELDGIIARDVKGRRL